MADLLDELQSVSGSERNEDDEATITSNVLVSREDKPDEVSITSLDQECVANLATCREMKALERDRKSRSYSLRCASLYSLSRSLC